MTIDSRGLFYLLQIEAEYSGFQSQPVGADNWSAICGRDKRLPE